MEYLAFHRVDDSHTLLLVGAACPPRFLEETSDEVAAVEEGLCAENLEGLG